MAIVKNLMVRAGADFSSLSKAFNKAQKQTKKFRTEFKTALRHVAIAAAAAGTAIYYASDKAIKAAEEEAIAQTKLSVIMRQRMGATNDAVKSIIDLASEQQKLGVIEDDVQISGAQMLATFLGQAESLKALVPAMNDLAAQQYGVSATSENLVAIGKAMGKAFIGQTTALQRMGITFTAAQTKIMKYGTESQKAALMADVIRSKVGDMNEELGNTSAGKITILKNSFSDLQEQFGTAIMPLRDVFVPVLQNVINYFSDLVNRMQPAIAYARVFLETLFNVKAATNAAAVSKSVNEESSAINDLGDAASSASKKLFGFDEINQLQEDTASSASDWFAMPNGSSETNTIADIFKLTSEKIAEAKLAAENFKSILKGIWDELSRVYETYLKPIFKGLFGVDLNNANTDFEGLGKTIADVGVTLAGIYVTVKGMKAIGGIASIFGSYGKASKTLFAGTGITGLLGQSALLYGGMVGGLYLFAQGLNAINDQFSKMLGYKKDLFGSETLINGMQAAFEMITSGGQTKGQKTYYSNMDLSQLSPTVSGVVNPKAPIIPQTGSISDLVPLKPIDSLSGLLSGGSVSLAKSSNTTITDYDKLAAAVATGVTRASTSQPIVVNIDGKQVAKVSNQYAAYHNIRTGGIA